MSVPFCLRLAILDDESAFLGLNRLAADCADNGSWLSKKHRNTSVSVGASEETLPQAEEQDGDHDDAVDTPVRLAKPRLAKPRPDVREPLGELRADVRQPGRHTGSMRPKRAMRSSGRRRQERSLRPIRVESPQSVSTKGLRWFSGRCDRYDEARLAARGFFRCDGSATECATD